MSDTQSAHTKVTMFRGKDGTECESFIHAVRRVAWEERKMQDSTWMANFASLHFSGRALKWQSDLALDVRHDWIKLEKALLERWPPPDVGSDDEHEAQTIPTPAAAKSHSIENEAVSDLGILELVYEDEAGFTQSKYLGTAISSKGSCCFEQEISKAMKVRWGRSLGTEPRIMECLKDSRYLWLALAWTYSDPEFGQGSNQWARITTADPLTLTTEAFRLDTNCAEGLFRVAAWKVDSEQNIVPVWKWKDEVFSLTVFEEKDFAYAAVDPVAYAADNSRENRARLRFKPVA
ncbi:hypothetical protein FRB90_007055 [Tulasnella sp. 427]|nr:hypothetical protein FRB90_007055 [Tulasnella sp. 427]